MSTKYRSRQTGKCRRLDTDQQRKRRQHRAALVIDLLGGLLLVVGIVLDLIYLADIGLVLIGLVGAIQLIS